MSKKFIDKVLSRSNQYNFFKKRYYNFKKKNKKLKKENFNLQLEIIDLKKQLGYNSKKTVYNKLISEDYDNINISIKSPNPINHHHWGDYFYAKSLKKSFEKYGFNVVIHEKGDWYNHDNEDIVIVLRGLEKYEVDHNSINIMWNISHPDDINFYEYESYDLVFIASESYSLKVKRKIKTNVEPLLQCSDTDIFYPMENDNLKDNEILFVGSTRGIYRDIIKDILNTNHDLSIYGPGWKKFVDEKYIKGDFIPNEKLNQYYSSCKILLNDHWDDMKEYGFISNRIFDALACGTLIISDKMPEIDMIFEGNVVTYTDFNDLNDKIGYYLNHDDEREKKAKNGRELVLNYHTFDIRVENIIKCLKELKF